MNYKGIMNTAITQFNKEENCYEVFSPLSDSLIGCARTPGKAHDNFIHALNETYVAYKEKTLARPPGRPRKNGVSIHALVDQSTKEGLQDQAALLGVSMGELITYLYLKQDNT